jgi:hypothetical protein
MRIPGTGCRRAAQPAPSVPSQTGCSQLTHGHILFGGFAQEPEAVVHFFQDVIAVALIAGAKDEVVLVGIGTLVEIAADDFHFLGSAAALAETVRSTPMELMEDS